MPKCKVCGKESKNLRKDGTCRGSYCKDKLCKCGEPLRQIATYTVGGYCCDSTDVEALYCKKCDVGKIGII